MFKADVQGVIDFTAIQWCGLRIARKKHSATGWIVQNVSRAQIRTLNSTAIGHIGGRQHPDRCCQ